MAKVKHIILIGMKACGKTSIGKQFAGESKRCFIDIDENILQLYQQNNPIHSKTPLKLEQIFSNVGEEIYEAYELLAIEQAINTLSNRRGILAISCGTLHNKKHLNYLSEHGKFFYLKGSYALLFPRWLMVEPILNYIADERTLFQTYHQQQDSFLESIADLVLDLDSLSLAECLSSLKTCTQKHFWYKHFKSSQTKSAKKSKKIFKKSLVYTEFDTDQNKPSSS